jgi:nucleoside-diphosphate-sugar epimerase
VNVGETATSSHGFWAGRRVLVTGGAGFIGSWVVDRLRGRGLSEADIVIPRSRDDDLRDRAVCERVMDGCDLVIHLAAPTGGIGFSRSHPASQFHDCTLIDLNLLEAARLAQVERVVVLGNLLAYPASAESPLRESQLHDGPVAATHLGVGLAKRNLVTLAEMYWREYDLAVTGVLSANAYGPRDRFDLAHSHVIPATIRKAHGRDDLVVWGDGSPTRDFLYVDDIAEGLLLAAERLEGGDFVNIASEEEVSIADLVRMIARLSDFSGEIVFDESKGGGDPRRVASAARAREALGFAPSVGLQEGLERTIAWYREHCRDTAGG